MPKPDQPINAAAGNPSRARRIAAFQKELDHAAKPHVLSDDGVVRAKTADLATPADRPAISRATTVLKKMTDATQRELDVLNGKAARPPGLPPARPPTAKTPAAPATKPSPPKRRPAAAPTTTPAQTAPASAAPPTTRTVSAVGFASLAAALSISKSELGRLMALGIVEREHYRTADGEIYWPAERVPQIVEAVVKHRASKPSPAAAAARPKVTFGPLMTDLPNMCRRLNVSPELLRNLVCAGAIPRGTPANSGNSEIFWPAADFKNIAQSVRRHLAAAGK